jgi:DNA-binding CsgD family transcriptional regulator
MNDFPVFFHFSPDIKMQSRLEQLESGLNQARSVRGALFALQQALAPHGGTHIAFVFMLHRKSYIRGDHVAAGTMPAEVTATYWSSGGTQTDPIVELVPVLEGPVSVDLDQLIDTPNTKYFGHPYLTAVVAAGYPALTVYPITMGDGTPGYGALTILGSREQRSRQLEPEFYTRLGRVFQRGIKTHGQLRHYFSLSPKECEALERMACGRTTHEIGLELGLKQRTIEIRLQNARKKLRAHTTTEAVYKASAYSVIFG